MSTTLLTQLQQEYREAQAADRQAARAHLDLVDRFYEERDPNVTQDDLSQAARVAEFMYAQRLFAYERLDRCKAALLEVVA